MWTGDDAGRYEIRIKGHLDSRWSAWFDGMHLTTASDGTTTIRGPVVDQAALHGLLQKLRDIGVLLISVARLDVDGPAVPPHDPSQLPSTPGRTAT